MTDPMLKRALEAARLLVENPEAKGAKLWLEMLRAENHARIQQRNNLNASHATHLPHAEVRPLDRRDK
jgi:hypothetical protein